MNLRSIRLLMFTFLLLIILLAHFFFLSPCSTQTHADDLHVINLGTLVRAWEDRQARTSSLDFSCSTSVFLSKVRASISQSKSKKKSGKLPYDINYFGKMRYVLDANKRARLECADKVWSATKGEYVAKNSTEVNDGKKRHRYFPSNAVGFRNAHILPPDHNARDTRILPLTLVYRPFDSTGAKFAPNAMTVADRNTDDAPSFLTVKHNDELIVVDSSREYVPVRYFKKNELGKTIRDISISYSHDDKYGWVPVSWKNVWLDSEGKAKHSVNASVVKYQINEQVDEEAFKITYEPPTWVSDYIQNERYIVRKNDIRPIQKGEFNGDNFQQLVESEPQTGLSLTLRFIIIIVSILAIIAGGVYRRLRRAT